MAVLCFDAREHQAPLANRVTAGRASLLTEKNIDEVAVPVQVPTPLNDSVYTVKLKRHTFHTGHEVCCDIWFSGSFPGVEHACSINGDDKKVGERETMLGGKQVAVACSRQFYMVHQTYDGSHSALSRNFEVGK